MKLHGILAAMVPVSMLLCGMALAGGTPIQFAGAGTFDQGGFDLSPCTAFGQPHAASIQKVSSGSTFGIVKAYGNPIFGVFGSTDPWGFAMATTVWLTNTTDSKVGVRLVTHHGPGCSNTCQANGNCTDATWTGCVDEGKPVVTVPANSTVALDVGSFDSNMTNAQFGNSFVTVEPTNGPIVCAETDWGQAGYDQVPGNE